MPELLTIGQFRNAVYAGRVRWGDCVLYDRGGRLGTLRWVIRQAQGRLLGDLWDGKAGRPSPEELAAAARYTHAGMVLDGELTGEMTSPRARKARWEEVLRPGDRIRVVRPAGASGEALRQARAEMLEICLEERAYPAREILGYYVWSWGLRKVALGGHFRDVFRDRHADVCSGTVWTCWRLAGAVSPDGFDCWPEAWYPGRMAVDTRYLRRVAEMRITKECAG